MFVFADTWVEDEEALLDEVVILDMLEGGD